MERPRRRRFGQILDDINKTERSWQEVEKEESVERWKLVADTADFDVLRTSLNKQIHK
jgi:hypothetical protein